MTPAFFRGVSTRMHRYKISEPTIYGTMSDEELVALFTGYGYKVRVGHFFLPTPLSLSPRWPSPLKGNLRCFSCHLGSRDADCGWLWRRGRS